MFIRFEFKKITKNKFNLIPVIILFLSIIVCFYFNNKNYKMFSFERTINEELTQTKQGKSESDAVRHDANASTDEKNTAIDTSKEYQNDINNYKEMERLYSSGNRSKAYKIRIKQLSTDFEVSKNEDYNDKSLTDSINKQMKFFTYLSKVNLPDDPEDFPSQGINYMTWVLQVLIPITIILTIIFIGVQLFSDNYRYSMNISSLLPINKQKKMLIEVGVVTMIGIGLMVLSLLSALGLGTVFKEVGSLNYPILSYFAIDKFRYIAVGSIIFKSLILECLDIIAVVLVTYSLVRIFKNKMASLLVIMLLEIGVMLLTTVVEPLQELAHLLPTTYLNSVTVVTGQAMNSFENTDVNFEMGTLVNLVFIVSLMVMNFMISKKRNY